MEKGKTIPVKLPDATLFDVDLSGISYILVKDLKLLMYQQGIPVLPDRMKLIHQNRPLGDVEAVFDLKCSESEPLHLVVRIIDGLQLLLSYDEFIAASHPKHSAINVPVASSISIVFKANQMGHMVYTPTLAHHEELRTLVPEKPLANASELSVSERVVLVQVDENLELRLDEIRYQMDSYGSLCGDPNSWQRYTSHSPIGCEISITPFYEPLPHELTLKPLKPLRFNTFYAVVLLNNVPTVPAQHPNEFWQYLATAIGSDKLIIFRTERPPVEKAHRAGSVVLGTGRASYRLGSSSRSVMS